MAFNITAINYAWVNENNQNLLTEAIIGAQTASLIQVYPGVKYKEELKYLNTDAWTQAGGCGFTASGNTSLVDIKDVQVTSLKWTEALCPDTLETTALQLSMKAGKNEKIPFEQAYVQLKMKQIQTALETMYWSSTTSSSVKCAGLVYQLNNDADVLDYSFNPCTTGQTFSTWAAAVYGMYNKLTPEAKNMNDLTLFVSYSAFSLIQQSMVIANLYAIDQTGPNLTPFRFPGTNVMIQPIKALDSQCVMVLSPASNLIWATDLVSEEDKISLWFSQDNQMVFFVANGKLGASYYFGEYIVLAQ
jgi:hypothetical protein